MKDILRKLWTDEEGATIVEYVLLLAVLALGVIAAIGALRTSVTGKYNATSTAVDTAGS